ncbi:DUF1003 domain-containing protein [Luteolibacter soli]|uniref:DUF1003 domain-containing protein n=1 Tax=Luteolibacter soli TaxID=3135280 RepID=A0ABU9B4U1_9BACT
MKRHRDSAGNASFHERAIGRAAGMFGTIGSVYMHFFVFAMGFLLATNVVQIAGLHLDVDSLTLLFSINSIFITTSVLLSQRRMQELSEVRANLTLHISLFEERETTRLIRIVRS